jgi:hypothetical protein
MAETVKVEGGGDGILIGVGLFVFLIIISLVVWAMNPDLFKKKEGDDCKIDDGDIRGTYEIDDKGKCVLKSCDTGWRVDGKKCTKILESIGGDKVPSPATPAPAGPAPAGPAPAGPAPAGPTPPPRPKNGDYWLVHTMPDDKNNPTNYMMWPQADKTLHRYPFWNDEKVLWDIEPSGKDDNKYWLVHTLLDTTTNVWTKYMMWPEADGTLNRYPFWADEKVLWEIVPSGNDDNKYWLVYNLPDHTVSPDHPEYGKIKPHHVWPQTDGKLGRWTWWQEDIRLWEIVPKSGVPSLGKVDVEGYTLKEYYES